MLIRTSLLLALTLTSAALADPITPPEHPERNFRAIGPGVYVRRDDTFEVEDGNVRVSLFSKDGIQVVAGYSLDGEELMGGSVGIRVDAGTLGVLRLQMITIDCKNRTYELWDLRHALPQTIWRAASTLPALAPVFRYVCAHLSTVAG